MSFVDQILKPTTHHIDDKHIDMYRMTLIKVFFPERRIRFELGLLYIYF